MSAPRGLWAVLLAALLTAGCSLSFDSGPGPTKAGEPVGPRYRFSLKDIEGRTVTLDGLLANHKAVLLNFWATWCPFCVEEMPDLVKLQEKYADKSFTVVGIDAGESLEEAATFAKKFGVNYPILLDEDLAVSQTYRIVGLPTSLLIRSDGHVLGEYHSVSAKLESDVEKALQ